MIAVICTPHLVYPPGMTSMQVKAEFRTSVRYGTSGSVTKYVGGVIYFFEHRRVATRSGAKGVTGATHKNSR